LIAGTAQSAPKQPMKIVPELTALGESGNSNRCEASTISYLF
jgi:hypothetical protein